MFLFQPPPPTPYDLRFSIAGIPVRVHPLFWLVALLFGASGALIQIPIWIIVVFVSILIHELGHAFALRAYGLNSQIILHFAGGLTVPEAAPWGNRGSNAAPGPKQEVFISLAGPFTGLIFATLVMLAVVVSGGTLITTKLLGFLPLPLTAYIPFGGTVLNIFVTLLLWVNVFWGLINLLPVFPLDGGQVARNVLIQYDPWDGVRKSLWISVVTGGILAVVGLIGFRSIYIAILFGFLAFQSYQSLQGSY